MPFTKPPYIYNQNIMIGIYKITNPKDKSYIGQSIDIESRHTQYKNGHCKQQPKLYNSIQKYGWDNHEVEIIVECGITELDNLEIYYIEKFNTLTNGLNLSGGGDGGGLKTKLTKQKISESHKGMKKPWAGKNMKLTKEHKEKLIKSKKNTLNPIFQYDMEGNFIQEFQNPKQASKHLNINNGYLSTIKDNFNKSINGYRFTSKYYASLPPYTDNRKKSILQYDKQNNLIKEWPSIESAAKSLNLNKRCISNVCSGQSNSLKGFIFKYKN